MDDASIYRRPACLGLRLALTAPLVAWILGVLAGCAATPKAATPTTPPPTSATAGATTIVAVAPPAQPCCPHPTMWEFLGVKGFAKVLGGGIDRLRNRLGSRFPGLEAKPPLLAITDPANMGPDAPPAAKAAAEAKAYEDAAPQKIKAIRYLSTLGCTECYPDIGPALLKALDDCTEGVRYEAVLALRKLSGGPCAVCQSNRCCNPEMLKRLDEMANGMNDRGCYREPSARVRRVARLAIAGCGGAIPPQLPTEGPQEPLPAPVGSAEPTPAIASKANKLPPIDGAGMGGRVQLTSAMSPVRNEDELHMLAEVNGEPIWEHEVMARVEQRLARSAVAQAPRSKASLLREELEGAISCKLLCQDARRNGFQGVALATAMSSQSGKAIGPEAVADETLAAEWLAHQIHSSADVSRQQIFAYYRTHLDRFQPAAEVRWERLSASASSFGSRQNALEAIEFLRDKMQGLAPSAPDGFDVRKLQTEHLDWTRRDQIASEAMAHWLFSLPVGTLSPVLDDVGGVCVIRVLERRQSRAITMEEAADTIRQELLAQQQKNAEVAVINALRQTAQIWTIFDVAPAATPRPMQTRLMKTGS